MGWCSISLQEAVAAFTDFAATRSASAEPAAPKPPAALTAPTTPPAEGMVTTTVIMQCVVVVDVFDVFSVLLENCVLLYVDKRLIDLCTDEYVFGQLTLALFLALVDFLGGKDMAVWRTTFHALATHLLTASFATFLHCSECSRARSSYSCHDCVRRPRSCQPVCTQTCSSVGGGCAGELLPLFPLITGCSVSGVGSANARCV